MKFRLQHSSRRNLLQFYPELEYQREKVDCMQIPQHLFVCRGRAVEYPALKAGVKRSVIAYLLFLIFFQIRLWNPCRSMLGFAYLVPSLQSVRSVLPDRAIRLESQSKRLEVIAGGKLGQNLPSCGSPAEFTTHTGVIRKNTMLNPNLL